MDEAQRKAARRRAVIAFVVAGVLVLVSVIGLAWTDDGHGRRGRHRSPVPGWDQSGSRDGAGSSGGHDQRRSGGDTDRGWDANGHMPGRGPGQAWSDDGGSGRGDLGRRDADPSDDQRRSQTVPDSSTPQDASTTTTTAPVGN